MLCILFFGLTDSMCILTMDYEYSSWMIILYLCASFISEGCDALAFVLLMDLYYLIS